MLMALFSLWRMQIINQMTDNTFDNPECLRF